jgi:hypothetical protein
VTAASVPLALERRRTEVRHDVPRSPTCPEANVSRRFAAFCALALSFVVARELRAQNDTVLVTVLRPTALKSAPSITARTIVIINPTTFGARQLRVVDGFLRLRVDQIIRNRPSTGQLGYIAIGDVDVDSGTTSASAPASADTAVHARAAAPSPSRANPPPPARDDAPTVPIVPAAAPANAPAPTPRAVQLVIRPNAPSPAPAAVDTPELNYLDAGALTAIVQRPMVLRIGDGRDSVVVPAGFVADFASVPRSLWTALSPVGAQTRALVVHDYLYWFQPCEREEADNLLMLAMREGGVADLQRGAVYAGVRLAGEDVWNAHGAARDRGELRVVPTGVAPAAAESWPDFRTRLGKADIRGTPGRMARQPYCELGTSERMP